MLVSKFVRVRVFYPTRFSLLELNCSQSAQAEIGQLAMARAGQSALQVLAKPCVAAMMRGGVTQSAALASTSSPLVSDLNSQRASMATAAAPAPKQNAAEFVVTKVLAPHNVT